MSKRFEYKTPNGPFVGVVSDKVAEILEKKGEGKILGDYTTDAPAKAEPEAKAKK